MKMFKRVLAAGAALMMAVTGMAMSASAANISPQSWLIRRVTTPGAPSSLTILVDPNMFEAPSSFSPLSHLSDVCTSYSSGIDANGNPDYAKFYGYLGDLAGNKTGNDLFTNKVHYSTTTVSVNFTNVTYGQHMWIKYELAGPSGIDSCITGTGTVS